MTMGTVYYQYVIYISSGSDESEDVSGLALNGKAEPTMEPTRLLYKESVCVRGEGSFATYCTPPNSRTAEQNARP